jgi:hypothetical protein
LQHQPLRTGQPIGHWSEALQAARQTKRLIRLGASDLAGRIEEELGLFRERLGSPEAAEAFRALMEKRKPDFSQFS